MPPLALRTKDVPAWAALLDRFYRHSGLSVPALKILRGEEMPQPYRSLLVHSSDMTPTLERFYGQRVGITVLSREHDDPSYYREVVLHVGPGKQPVEYGAIRIYLDHLPGAVRQIVLEEKRPLGNILQTEGIPHIGWPQAFFRSRTDAHMRSVLQMEHSEFLYGRRNVLLDGSRRMLAEVIEILAPATGEGNS